jgi:tetratricopeptide (TPR) repeat protein
MDPLSRSLEETIHKICSFLQSRDLEVFVCLSKHLSCTGIKAANYQQSMLVKVFLSSAIEWFAQRERFSVQIPKLTMLKEKIESPNVPNLKELKKSLVNVVKQDLVPALKTVPKLKVAKALTDCKAYDLLADVALLADFERRIDAASSIPTLRQKSDALIVVCQDLLEAGNYDRARQLAIYMPFMRDKGAVLKDISVALLNAGKIEEAVVVLNEIIGCAKLLGVTDFSDCIKGLREKGEIEKAEEIIQQSEHAAQGIPDCQEQIAAFRSVSQCFARVGIFDKAIALAQQIPSINEQAAVLHFIAATLTKCSRFDEAIAVANQVKTGSKVYVIIDIAENLIAKDQLEHAALLLDQAVILAGQILNTERQASVLRTISVAFARSGLHDRALGLVDRMGDNVKKIDALVSITFVLNEKGELGKVGSILEQAEQAAYEISHVYEQATAFCSISMQFTRMGNFERGIKLASQIAITQDRAAVLDFISAALLRAGRFEEAISVTENNNNEKMGGVALFDLSKL